MGMTLNWRFIFFSAFLFLLMLPFYMSAMVAGEERPRSRSVPRRAVLKGEEEAVREENTSQRSRRNSLNFELSGNASAMVVPAVVAFDGVGEEGGWVYILQLRRPSQPRTQVRDFEVISDDSSQSYLDCKIHHQPGPAEGIFDGDPTRVRRYKPYFVCDGGWSSIMITPLNLLIFSDVKTLNQTRGQSSRAIGTIKLFLIALYALDDLMPDRHIDNRVYHMSASRLKALGHELFQVMLEQEGKTLETLEDQEVLAGVRERLVLGILTKIGYSEGAIQNLHRLARALQERTVEADIIPSTYQGLEDMYKDGAPSTSQISL